MGKNRLIAIWISLVVVFLAGIAGYMIIEGWTFFDAVYMVIITLASVGFSETHPLSFSGRIFTMFLIIFGMGTLLSGITSLTAFLVEGKLSELFKRKKMNKRVGSLNHHYIVCGAGNIGRNIIDELDKTERSFVVIDLNPSVCKALEEKGVLHVVGDATDTDVLKSANIENAKGLFCALGSDADNLLLIMTARGINPEIRIITRAEKRESTEKMMRAGANGVVMPQFIGGMRMASEMVRPAAVTFLDKMLKGKEGTIRVEDVAIASQSELIGRKLKDCPFTGTEGILLVALGKGDRYIINPSGNETLENSDIMVFIGQEKELQTIRRLAGQSW